MPRTLSRTVNRPRPATRVAVLVALCSTAASLGACRTSTPIPGASSNGKAPITSTVGMAAPSDAGATADGRPPTPTVAAHLTAEDEAAMVSLIRALFGPAVGSSEPDMQDIIVRQVTTTQLSALRGGQPPAEGAIGYSAGYVWVIGFKTSEPLTRATFMSDPAVEIELKDIGLTESLAGPDGRTSVFYIVATQSIEGNRRYVPRSQGVLVEGISTWSLDDLAALPATP